jgi:dTDP-L-rhamnose 4-epimerase
VRSLCDAGHAVTALDALLPSVHPVGDPPLDSRAQFVRADVRDAPAYRALLPEFDAVCHQAAMVGLGVDMADLPDYAGHNDLGTAVLLAELAAAGIKRLVLASSMVIYGEGAYTCPHHGSVRAAPRRPDDLEAGRFEPPCPICGGPLEPALVSEDAPADPRNAYATSKLAQEHYVRGWARETGSSAIALRYHNVYGPGMPRDTPYAGVAAIFRSSIENGHAPQVFEDGGQRRDFVHVSDVAGANVAALSSVEARDPGSTTAYNIGSGTPHTVGEMASALCRQGQGSLTPQVNGRYRLGDVRHITADSSRARAELNWTPQLSFEQGMRQFVTDPLRAPAAQGK